MDSFARFTLIFLSADLLDLGHFEKARISSTLIRLVIFSSLLTINLDMLSTVVQHFCAQVIFPGAVAVGGPLKSGVANFLGLGKIRQLRQHSHQDRLVASAIVGRAEGATDGMVNKYGAWRCDLAHDVEGGTGEQGRNAMRFDHMGDETDGLMAKRSVGYEQR